jgi:pentatricopeptide repeat protein
MNCNLSRTIGIVLLLLLLCAEHTFVCALLLLSPTSKMIRMPTFLTLATSDNHRGTYDFSSPYGNNIYFDSYKIAMSDVLSSFRVMQKKDREEDLESVKRFLFASNRTVDIDISVNDSNEFHKKIKTQAQNFEHDTKLNLNQRQLALRALSYMGDYCAKKQTSFPLHVAWDKIKEAGLTPRNHALSSYLYILSSQIDDSNEVQISYDGSQIPGEVAMFHDFLYEPTENTVSIRIKSFVGQGNAEDAEDLLWGLGAANPHVLRLRTCLPVLELYCQQGNMSSALRVYHHMRDAPSVHFESDTYVNFISSLARLGYFKCDAHNIEGASDLGYPNSGPELLDRLASDMAEEILEITSMQAIHIRNSMVEGFIGTSSVRNLAKVPFDCTLAPVDVPAEPDELVASRVTINSSSMSCPRTNTKLRLIHLENDQKEHMHTTLLKMADTQFEAYDAMLQSKGHKSSKANNLEENYAAKHLESFADWLDKRDGEPFTVIVDGANVAYYGIGSINYHQVKLVVDTLEDMGETPLVVIPQKYTQNKFYLRKGYIQELTLAQTEILENLDSNGKLYKVPQRCLDDYYWMLSSVSNQTVSRGDRNIDVSVEDDRSRWPGTRPLIITNDQMRDHKLDLLEPRLFRRWSSNTIVNYHIPPYTEDKEQHVTLTTAEFVSREIQSNPANTSDGIVWHFPVCDWHQNDRFCLRLPHS